MSRVDPHYVVSGKNRPQFLCYSTPVGSEDGSRNTINATGARAVYGDWIRITPDFSIYNGTDWKVDDLRFTNALRHKFRKKLTAYQDAHRNKAAERSTLVRQLTAFDSLSHNKPLFFSTIYCKFGGDIKAYVNYLYKRSFLTNRFRLNIFMRWPSAKKIEQDPGVQFILGLALYELWLKRGGEAVAEEPQDSTAVPPQTDSIPDK